jgi:hypothetical protein
MENKVLLKLSKDLIQATATLSRNEVRFLVDSYYQMQNDRIRSKNQIRAVSETDEPHEVISWFADNKSVTEKRLKQVLTAYSASNPVGEWSMSIPGIAGVISSGLLAHIDMDVANNVGQILSFAGMLPYEKEWKKGMTRPFNAKLKTLCWKIGESFVKVSNKEGDFYGKIYKEWKESYLQRNEAGEYAEQAKAILEAKNFNKTTDAYKAYIEGKLPPAHIQARAKRKAVQLFLSHWFEVAYFYEHGTFCPALPYIIEQGHSGYIPIPNCPFDDKKAFDVKLQQRHERLINADK